MTLLSRLQNTLIRCFVFFFFLTLFVTLVPNSALATYFGPYNIRSENDDKCLGVPNHSTANGTKLEEIQCDHARTDQQFYWEGPYGPDVQFRMINKNSGKCVDVTGNGLGDGVLLQQWTCLTNSDGTHPANQLWQRNLVSGGHYNYIIFSYRSSKCMDVKDSSPLDGTAIQQWQCHTPLTPNQLWGFFTPQ